MAQTLLSTPGAKAASPAKTAAKPTSANGGGGRLLYIDNLRWVMIMLVVSMHAACTYSHLGSWYYMEDSPVSQAETGIFATYQATLQSFFMGFLFFIAGYFVPNAYDQKGAAKFIRDRAFRLGLPLLFFMFVLQPIAIYCIGLFHGEAVAPLGFTDLYARYIINGRWLGGTGPLWFCEALLIFCLGYALFRTLQPLSNRQHPAYPGHPAKQIGLLPNNLKIWGLIAAITGLTFLVRFPWPNGTAFYNLQFCYFSQYVLYFCAGTLAFRGDWLNRFSVSSGKYWGRVALIGGLIGWVALLVFGGAFKGQLLAYRGGLHWQSLGMAFWESMTGVAISTYLTGWFREKFNRQGATARFFSANAFAVYVFHTPILIAISRMISYVHFPLLLKFAALTLISIAVSYALSSLLFRRLPLLKKNPVSPYLGLVSYTRYLMVIGALVLLSGCHKDTAHPPAALQPSAYIYVGGSVVLPSGAQHGIYFKNGINAILTNGASYYDTVANASLVSAMAVLDSVLYMATNTAGYWRADSFISVNSSSSIEYLALNNNTVALAGFNNTFGLAYWVNGIETNVMNTFNRTVYPNQGFVSYDFSGMAISGNEVAISGRYNMMDEPIPGATTADTSTVPGLYETIWLNGNIQILYHDYWNIDVAYTSTVGVAFSGIDIYIAANRTSDSGNVNSGGYYKNDTWNAINNGAFWPNSIYAAGTNVYIAGYTYTFPPYSNFRAAYCKNGNLIPLAGIATKAITTYGTDLYILGIDNDGNYVVWKNGAVIETLGSATSQNLTCIAIAN